jgi:hypothetical protein
VRLPPLLVTLQFRLPTADYLYPLNSDGA